MPEQERDLTDAITVESQTDTANREMPEPVGTVASETRDTGHAITIPSGEALTSPETAEIVRRARARVILLAGAQESGKTTLIASVFFCFQRGPFANFQFADSLTLRGLERRCWLSRTASMGRIADTERSKVGKQNYLHLRVRKAGSPDAFELLFCDLSGEIFERVINTPAASSEIEELDRIDHLTLLVDGGKLRRFDQRQKAQRDARLLLRGLLDSGALSRVVPVEVVFTKIDMFGSGPGEKEEDVDPDLFASESETRAFIEQIKQEMTREFEGKTESLNFFESVARETDITHKLGQGIDLLLEKWTFEVRPAGPVIKLEGPLVGPREIDKFLKREMGVV